MPYPHCRVMGKLHLLVFDLKASKTPARKVLDKEVTMLGPDDCITFLRSTSENLRRRVAGAHV